MYPWLPAPCKQDECFQEAQPQTRFCSCACSLRSSCALSFWDVLFPAQVGFFRDENGKKCARADLCAWVCKKGEQGPCGACCGLVGLILALLQPLKEGRLWAEWVSTFPSGPEHKRNKTCPKMTIIIFFVKGVKIATKFLVLPRGFRGHLEHKIQLFEVGFHWSCMCVSKISRCLYICLTKKLVLCELSPIPQIWFPRRMSYLLILRTNYGAFLFSQESHPHRINIAFSEHISWLRTSAVGISYCGAVICPAGLLLPDCTGEKREKLLWLAEMLCLNYYSSWRSHGPP